ncbi:MAG TPA: hypothetical protein VGJ70_18750 [Solirubrobacteraceae bacterium]
MSDHAANEFDFEGLLRQALSPVDPPEDLVVRLESTLQSLTEMAAEELDAWELSAMRDPRNWVRPVAAAAIGTAAGAGLVVLRVRSHQKRRRAQTSGSVEFAERTVRAVGGEVRKLLSR